MTKKKFKRFLRLIVKSELPSAILARDAGLAVKTISGLVTGTGPRPTNRTVQKILRALGKDWSDLEEDDVDTVKLIIATLLYAADRSKFTGVALRHAQELIDGCKEVDP